jgi:hypothetical protein
MVRKIKNSSRTLLDTLVAGKSLEIFNHENIFNSKNNTQFKNFKENPTSVKKEIKSQSDKIQKPQRTLKSTFKTPLNTSLSHTFIPFILNIIEYTGNKIRITVIFFLFFWVDLKVPPFFPLKIKTFNLSHSI